MGGNICNASPISDLNPLLMAARAVVNLASVDGIRSVAVDTLFFTGYKQTALKPNEILVSVVIPFTTKVWRKPCSIDQLAGSAVLLTEHVL